MTKWTQKGLSAALACALGAAGGSLALAQAVNDDCAGAILVSEGTVSGSLAGATPTDDGRDDADAPNDLWYQYLAPFDGVLVLRDANGERNFDFAIWSACPPRGIELTSSVRDLIEIHPAAVDVLAGQLYHIRIMNRVDRPENFDLQVDVFPRVDSQIEPPSGDVGPDVQYRDIVDYANHGNVGGIRAYTFGTGTCNVGTQNLAWTNTTTPGVAFNLFRLANGRLEQIGLSFAKTACCAAAGTGCGMACNGQGGSVLGAGCLDVYGAGWNQQQSRLAARSAINAWSGAFAGYSTATGNAIFKRCQVMQTDLQTAGALYFADGIYVGTDDATSGNRNNNASYRRVSVNQTSFDLTSQGSTVIGSPGILAWRANGGGAGVVDTRVLDGTADVPSEGRFHYAHKVTDLGGGMYRYDYAVYNLSSDRSGGSFTVPIPFFANVSNFYFHDVFYHSGEPYDNTDWVREQTPNTLVWHSPQTFAQNPNSNALRWGTMYNFGFDCDRPPVDGPAQLGLFKPHTTSTIALNVRVPQPPIHHGDMNCDGFVDNADIDGYVLALNDPAGYATTYPGCNINNADTNGDSVVDNADIDSFVDCLLTGVCP